MSINKTSILYYSRAHTLDNKIRFENGELISKQDFVQLKQRVSSGAVTCGFKLTDMVLHCVQSDRQNVASAIALYSLSVAVMFREYFATDENKLCLADFIETVHYCSQMFNSRKVYDNQDPQKNALGTDLEKQLKKLKRLIYYMKTIKIIGPGHAKFPRAMIMALKGSIQLQELLSQKYGVPHLRLSVTTQDPLESFFSVIKGIFGYESRPTPLDFCRRMDHFLTTKFLQEEKVTIFDIERAMEETENLNSEDVEIVDVSKGQGPWSNAEILEDSNPSKDILEGLKYLGLYQYGIFVSLISILSFY